MEYLTQYLFYPHMWGENVRKRSYQCSLRTLLISLPKGVPWERLLVVTYGVPKHCPSVGSEPYWDLVNPLVGWVGGILKRSCLMAEV